MTATFDQIAFYQAVDLIRFSRHLSWQQVAWESGVQHVATGKMSQWILSKPHADTIAALCVWGGLNANNFFTKKKTHTNQTLEEQSH
ncbi:MAG TPA: hypothetical protein VFA10_14525 [Ktedonobacteraceae bacterium]|nr:hypothetical protein [Ktedonobacteraceae bacterium]